MQRAAEVIKGLVNIPQANRGQSQQHFNIFIFFSACGKRVHKRYCLFVGSQMIDKKFKDGQRSFNTAPGHYKSPVKIILTGFIVIFLQRLPSPIDQFIWGIFFFVRSGVTFMNVPKGSQAAGRLPMQTGCGRFTCIRTSLACCFIDLSLCPGPGIRV